MNITPESEIHLKTSGFPDPVPGSIFVNKPPTYNSVNVIIKEFTIDKSMLQEDFMSESNKIKRDWFRESFDTKQYPGI